jgi:PAS domain-containing protein
MVTDVTRRWMREFATLRQEAAKLRPRDGSDATIRDLLDRALQLADAIREDAAGCHQRCAALAAEVRAAHARVDTVFDNLPMAVVTTDLHGVIQSGNRAAAGLFGRSHTLKDQLLLHYAEDRTGFTDLLQRARVSEEVVTATLRIRPRERAAVDVTIAALLDARDADYGTLLWFLRPEAVQPRVLESLRPPSTRKRLAPDTQPRL